MAGLALGATLLVACGSPNGIEPRAGGGTPGQETEHDRGKGLPDAPPPVTVRYDDGSFELDPWTYCYGSGCADGAPPADPPDVGSPDKVTIDYSLEGWTFDASFEPAGEKCGRVQTVPLSESGDGSFVLEPAGYADTYDVTLFGRGHGDLFVTFRWTTPHDGPRPTPTARLALIANHDGRPDSYGVELMLENLAETPKKASATITVAADNGGSLTFDADRSGGCWAEGTVYWDGPDDQGVAAARLGEAPFTYDVEVTLDGERYAAHATWPNDEIEGNEPSVELDFSPPLPALP